MWESRALTAALLFPPHPPGGKGEIQFYTTHTHAVFLSPRPVQSPSDAPQPNPAGTKPTPGAAHPSPRGAPRPDDPGSPGMLCYESRGPHNSRRGQWGHRRCKDQRAVGRNPRDREAALLPGAQSSSSGFHFDCFPLPVECRNHGSGV